MSTLEFMEKELRRCEINLKLAEDRKASAEHIENIKAKVQHYQKVCKMLKEGD